MRTAPDALIYIVGTKFDEPEAKLVKLSDALKLAKEWSAGFFTISSNDGTNVNELFDNIYSKISI